VGWWISEGRFNERRERKDRQMNKPLRVAVYARVSTLDKGQDPQLQTRELHEYCGRRGWEVVAEYVDIGVSGAKESRPRLNQLMADAARRKFDVVAVWRWDRFARSVSHLLRALETFKALGVDFVSLTEAVDTSTPMGKMVFTVLGAVAELERSLIAERVRAGLRHARSKGKRLGRPTRPVDAPRALQLKCEGRSWPDVARLMNVPLGSLERAVRTFKKVSAEVAVSS
jgi:DNA invertase Pin-like site-specific DNA recombinase